MASRGMSGEGSFVGGSAATLVVCGTMIEPAPLAPSAALLIDFARA